MKNYDKLFDTLRKKAFGFSYTESTLEYESVKVKPYLFCDKRSRLYFKNGYVKVKKLSGGLDVVIKKIVKLRGTFSKLKFLKNN